MATQGMVVIERESDGRVFAYSEKLAATPGFKVLHDRDRAPFVGKRRRKRGQKGTSRRNQQNAIELEFKDHTDAELREYLAQKHDVPFPEGGRREDMINLIREYRDTAKRVDALASAPETERAPRERKKPQLLDAPPSTETQPPLASGEGAGVEGAAAVTGEGEGADALEPGSNPTDANPGAGGDADQDAALAEIAERFKTHTREQIAKYASDNFDGFQMPSKHTRDQMFEEIADLEAKARLKK